jgi:alcohol dehydrogenase class IV
LTPDDLLAGPLQPSALPLAMIPTTAGTGSETTQYSVLTIASAQNKRLFASPAFFPAVAMLDAKYTMELPRTVTVHTAVDALSHLLEGMLTVRSNKLTDTFSRKGLGLIAAALRKLLDGKALEYGDREQLLFASMLGGVVIANVGTTLVHAMGFPLTYFKGIDHGPANGFLLREMLKLFDTKFPERVAETLDCVGIKTADEFGRLMTDSLGEPPVRLTPEEVRQYTKASINAPNVKNSLYEANEQEMAEIYTASLG